MNIFNKLIKRISRNQEPETLSVTEKNSGVYALNLIISNHRFAYSIESLFYNPIIKVYHGKDTVTIATLFGETTYWAKGFSAKELNSFVKDIITVNDYLRRTLWASVGKNTIKQIVSYNKNYKSFV